MSAAMTPAAVRRFAKFHGRAPDKVSSISIPYPKSLVYLGQAVAIEYASNKLAMGARRSRVYRHLFGAGVKLYTDPGGKALYVIGGRFRVTDWLRH